MSMPSGRKRRDFCSSAAVMQISWLKLCFLHLTNCQHRTIICLLVCLSFLSLLSEKKKQMKEKDAHNKTLWTESSWSDCTTQRCSCRCIKGRSGSFLYHLFCHLLFLHLSDECLQVFGTDNMSVFICLKSCINMDIRVLVYLGWCV